MNPTLPAPNCIIDKITAVHRLNVLTLNVHKGFTFFNRRFILPELRDAVRATGADLVFLQEVHGSHQPQFAYGRNAVYPHGDHGNALLSKFPIVRSENLDVSVEGNEQRGLLHCQLEVPGHDEVHAICVHLGLREAHRQKQVSLLFELLDRLPAKAPVIIAGDFNDWRLKADAVLSERLIEAFGERFGSPARSFPARLPLLRLDRIYVRNAMPHAAKVLSNYPWSHLSDHAPLAAEINV